MDCEEEHGPEDQAQAARDEIATLQIVLSSVKGRTDAAARKLAAHISQEIKEKAITITKSKPLVEQLKVLQSLVDRRETSHQAACVQLQQAQKEAQQCAEELQEATVALEQVQDQVTAEQRVQPEQVTITELALLLAAAPRAQVQELLAALVQAGAVPAGAVVQPPPPPIPLAQEMGAGGPQLQVPSTQVHGAQAVKEENTAPVPNIFVPAATRPFRRGSQRARSVGSPSSGRRSRSPFRKVIEESPGGQATPVAGAGQGSRSQAPKESASAVFHVDDEQSSPA
jgi:hypothetical protein